MVAVVEVDIFKVGTKIALYVDKNDLSFKVDIKQSLMSTLNPTPFLSTQSAVFKVNLKLPVKTTCRLKKNWP